MSQSDPGPAAPAPLDLLMRLQKARIVLGGATFETLAGLGVRKRVLDPDEWDALCDELKAIEMELRAAPRALEGPPESEEIVTKEWLRRENQRLRDALAPFVAIGNVAEWGEQKVESSRPDGLTAALCVTLGDIRRARKLLEDYDMAPGGVSRALPEPTEAMTRGERATWRAERNELRRTLWCVLRAGGAVEIPENLLTEYDANRALLEWTKTATGTHYSATELGVGERKGTA